MPRRVYDESHLAAWTAVLKSKRPRMIEEAEWPSFPQIEAFRPVALSQGMALRLATRDHGEFDFIINPVAARHLAACILTMGIEAGWLSGGGDVICPPAPSLDA